jgi:hypothetical protein
MTHSRTYENFMFHFQRLLLLEQTYQSVEDIDLYIGMLMESPCDNGALVSHFYVEV